MKILSQDKSHLLDVGRKSFWVSEMTGYCHIIHSGQIKNELAKYENMDTAKRVIKQMCKAIAAGEDIFEMPEQKSKR